MKRVYGEYVAVSDNKELLNELANIRSIKDDSFRHELVLKLHDNIRKSLDINNAICLVTDPEGQFVYVYAFDIATRNAVLGMPKIDEESRIYIEIEE